MARRKNNPHTDWGKKITDYSRDSKGRKTNRTILVVCEGEATEYNYFHAIRRSLRIPGLTVQIYSGRGRTDAQGIVNETIQHRSTMDWDNRQDQAWSVFDREASAENQTFFVAVEKAKKENIHLAVSNPAFEYWLLLHFECSDQPFLDAGQVLECLRCHIPGYAKQKKMDINACVQNRTPTAIHCAQRLSQNAVEAWDTFPNPSTGVYQLLALIETLQSSLMD